ncbi:cupin domain-containing protein [Pusillimonas sp. MFBS29]|uniref:cupin domain-containing protein n=1 Tax=Pusillimonas sp. MFBS29 TaxID=2886690 RepID=UPI001D0F7927|nr:cupin domain-containing protein [Pusillimonas sp. MFBS29]MCC2595646.1 cupin domain-containing protein [Pusillimonas sp. MFBS29]
MTINPEVDRLIRRLDLKPHPEGGHYIETYRSTDSVVREGSGSSRSACTAIYYLLSAGAYSAWHRIDADELWHFHKGGPVLIHVIDAAGAQRTHVLGDALHVDDASFQVMVPAGCWFAAELANPDDYALAGCTVAPGFEFDKFELAVAAALIERYPQHTPLIQRLSKTV